MDGIIALFIFFMIVIIVLVDEIGKFLHRK